MTNWLIVSLSVLLLDAVLGDPESRFHPVALLGNYAAKVEQCCRQGCGNTILAGAVGWGLVTLPLTLLAGVAVWALAQWSIVAALAFTMILGWICIALQSLIRHARRIRRPLAVGDLAASRQALAMIVTRDTAMLDESQIVRGGIESVSENLVDAVTSTLFYLALGYFLAGLPGAAAGVVFLRAVNTLDACWGYHNERYELFGKFAARADDAAHFVPARLTMFAIALAAPWFGGSLSQTVAVAVRCRKMHPSPNSIWAMAAFAGALKVRLGGPTVYHGQVEDYPEWGNGRARLNGGDLRRAERLAVVTALIFWLMLTGGYALWLIV